jgi:hypothetical protein
MADGKRSMKFGDKDYAFVPDRIKQFREENAHGDIDTVPTWMPDGGLMFKATIVRDRSDPSSARATGNATYTAEEMKKAKAFEKLETISVGRALANIGYLNDGQVATTEELQELAEFKEQQRLELQGQKIQETIDSFASINDLTELRTVFARSGVMNEPAVVEAAKTRSAEIQAAIDAAKPPRPTGGKVVASKDDEPKPTEPENEA